MITRNIGVVLLALVLFSATPAEKRQPLEVTFTNIKQTNAPIYIAVNEYSESFPFKNKVIKYYRVEPTGQSSATITISDLNYGKYALTVFQDLNGNQQIDKGFLGIPVEPFAFSNNYKPVFRAPRWSDCEFMYSPSSARLEITRFIKML